MERGEGMTREEAIKELERAFDVLDHSCHMDNRRKEAFNMARVSLSAIEDIKAEIKREYLSEGHLTEYWDGIETALEIINKHTADMRGAE